MDSAPLAWVNVRVSSVHTGVQVGCLYSQQYFPEIFVPLKIFFLFIKFIGVTLVNKIIQVSGAQFHNTSFVHWTVCSPPQVKSPSITIYPPYILFYLPLPHLPLAITVLVSVSISSSFSFLLNPSIPNHSPNSCQPALSMSLSLFCLLFLQISHMNEIIWYFFL